MREEFDEIRPYEAGEMKQAFDDLLNDRQFNIVMKGFAPWLPKSVRNGLLRLAFMGGQVHYAQAYRRLFVLGFFYLFLR